MRKNQFWKGMLFGAIAGGALSLLDKETRQVMKDHVQNTSEKFIFIVKNPGEITEKVKESAGRFKTTVEQMSEDIAYITEKVDELRQLTPQVTDIIKDTKDAFLKDDSNLAEGGYIEK